MALQAFRRMARRLLLQELIRDNERNRFRIDRRLIRDSWDSFQMAEVDFGRSFRLSKGLVRQSIITLRPHVMVERRTTCIPLEFKVLTLIVAPLENDAVHSVFAYYN